MYAPRVFVSMIGVLLAFAVATYWMTGSAWDAFLQTLLCAVILQVGYFAGILYLVRREKLKRQEEGQDASSGRQGVEARMRDDRTADAGVKLKISE